MKQKSWISIVFSFASQCRGKIVLSVLCAIISRDSCRTDTLLECLPDYHALYRRLTCDGRGLEMVLDRTWRLCDTLLALWYFNEPVPHIRIHHFGEYSFDPCPAADESAAGNSHRRACG